MNKRQNVEKDFTAIQLEVECDYFTKVVNRYEELYVLSREEEISETGFGEKTVLSRDKETGRLVIKKFVSREQGRIYEKLLGRFHPNVVPVLDIAYREKFCVVILEYISGITVEQRMKEQGIFTEKEAVDAICQIASGLEFVHSFDIIHRDINPANILVSSDWVIKITDLGIARNKKENQRTDTSILGTVGYAAPEQFGFAQTDVRTDIYSLGVLLNVMLTGKLPTVLTYNGKLKAIIEKAIRISPEERFQSIAEFMAELKDLFKDGANKEGLNRFATLKERTQNSAQVVEREEKPVPDHSKIPGFRTGKAWKKVVAVFLYICMALFSIVLIEEAFSKGNLFIGILEIPIMFLTFGLPFMIASNWGNWKERVYPFSKMDRDLILLIRIIVPIVLFYIGLSLEVWNRSR